MKALVWVCAISLGNLGCSTPATTPAAEQPAVLNDAPAVQALEATLAKPLPEAWKGASVAFVPDPIAGCPSLPEAELKKQAEEHIAVARAAVEEAGITVVDDLNGGATVFAVRLTATCNEGEAAADALVMHDVYAMPRNEGRAATSAGFGRAAFDAGKVTLGLMRDDKLVAELTAPAP